MADDDDVLDLADRLKKADRPFAMATVVRTESATSAKAGAKAVVDKDGSIRGWIGGGCTQPAVRKAARAALHDGKARLIRVRPDAAATSPEGVEDFTASCHSGGTLDIFIEPMLPPPSVLIIGASPAGQILAGLAAQSGFRVTAAVQKQDRELFGAAHQVIEGFDLGAQAADIESFIVVATQGKGDRRGLEAAIATNAPYVAFISSRRKAAKLKQELLEQGCDRSRVNAIRAPAGLNIGAVTADEIAVSILAEIVQERRAASRALAPGDTPESRPEEGIVSSTVVSEMPAVCPGESEDLN